MLRRRDLQNVRLVAATTDLVAVAAATVRAGGVRETPALVNPARVVGERVARALAV